MTRPSPDVGEYCTGVRAGERRLVAKTITLLESRRPDHVALGREVLERLAPDSGGSRRIGISGPPGVGKSTLIECLGMNLIEQGQRVAVLAVDPTSPVTGGSILGDKTRMVRLSRSKQAFIRPSPSGLTLGGVARRTREALLVCEAAGYDIVIIETVGVGQSEMEVASMVDFFALLLQPGAGDDLQGIKRGVLELADVLVVNKADGDQEPAAVRTQRAYSQALALLRSAEDGWTPQVLMISALTGKGVSELWATIERRRESDARCGEFERRRERQSVGWLERLIDDGLRAVFQSDPMRMAELDRLRSEVEARTCTPPEAARQLLQQFQRTIGKS